MARSFVGIGFVRIALLGAIALHGCATADSSTQEPADSPDSDAVTPPPELAPHNKVKDPPPTCNDPRYVDYNSTTTAEDDQVYQTCNGYNIISQYITCSDYQNCTRTYTWHHSFTCMNNGEYYLETTTLLSSSLSCAASYYTQCPNPFFEDGPCW